MIFRVGIQALALLHHSRNFFGSTGELPDMHVSLFMHCNEHPWVLFLSDLLYTRMFYLLLCTS
jgi:hypothetical protein